MGSNTKELVVLATARAKPGKEGALERALRDVAALTALERWSSPEDHQRHLRGNHLEALMARFEGVLAGPPEIAVRTPL